METGCLGEPPYVGETGQSDVVVLHPERDGEGTTLRRTRPYAVGCDIASWNARRQDLSGGRPVKLHLHVRVAHVFLDRCIPDFCVFLAPWPHPVHLKSKWGRC